MPLQASMPNHSPDLLQRGLIDTPIGRAVLVVDAQRRLRAFDWEDHESRILVLLKRFYGPGVTLSVGKAPGSVRQPLEAYFAGEIDALAGISCALPGTAFQRRVWGALRRIPAGSTRAYSELAAKIGRPTAVRAVGAANGANPISLVIPCHRLIGSNGSLTGYGSGIERKRWLLQHEGVDVGKLVSP